MISEKHEPDSSEAIRHVLRLMKMVLDSPGFRLPRFQTLLPTLAGGFASTNNILAGYVSVRTTLYAISVPVF